jgi:hypothetical protein
VVRSLSYIALWEAMQERERVEGGGQGRPAHQEVEGGG